MRIIKKYMNRKLYDTKNKRYTTISELTDMIKHGISLKVVDNKSNVDITYYVKLQCLMNNELNKNQKYHENLDCFIRKGL